MLPNPPAGTSVVRADERSLAPLIEKLTGGADGHIVSTQAGLVIAGRRQTGTAVIVGNSTEETNHPREILLGAQDAERESGIESRPFTLAGRLGVLIVGTDRVMVIGSVGTCGLVVLVDKREAALRRVAEAIRQPT